MSLSTPFIHRPIGTMLLTLGLALAGAVSFFLLPVAPLPQVDYPTISVSASLPGASPDTMAATVATPLERSLGAIAGVTEITSRSILGSTSITLQFDLDRNVDSAARDVQAAINAARTLLPTGMPSNPTYRKVNPADSPIMILALTSDLLTRGQMYDAASTVLAQKLSQVEGVGQATVSGGALPAVRVELDPVRLASNGISLEQVRSAIVSTNANRPLGAVEREDHYWQVATNDQARVAADYAPLVLRWKNGQAVRLQDVAEVVDSVQDVRNFGVANGKPAVLLQVYKQSGANILEAVERVRSLLPALQASIPAAMARWYSRLSAGSSVEHIRSTFIAFSSACGRRAGVASCLRVASQMAAALAGVMRSVMPKRRRRSRCTHSKVGLPASSSNTPHNAVHFSSAGALPVRWLSGTPRLRSSSQT